MRPKSLAEILGQDHLLGPEGPLGRMLAARKLNSLILWGPPGCGKTTIARLLAEDTDLHFEPLSAVFSGVADLRRIFEAARQRRKDGKGTLLFVDEIHRFNRAQQDGFLPYVEDGTVTLIGATTENPSFEVNAALLSRCRVYSLQPLSEDDIVSILERALGGAERGLGATGATAEPDALETLVTRGEALGFSSTKIAVPTPRELAVTAATPAFRSCASACAYVAPARLSQSPRPRS